MPSLRKCAEIKWGREERTTTLHMTVLVDIPTKKWKLCMEITKYTAIILFF